jgi:hypothetical protein
MHIAPDAPPPAPTLILGIGRLAEESSLTLMQCPGIGGKEKIAMRTAAFTAAALLAAATAASAAELITSVTTELTTVSGSSQPNTPGANGSTTFDSGSNYDINWQGQIESITSFQTASGTYTPVGVADQLGIRRGAGPNTGIVWFRGDADPTDPNTPVNLNAPQTSYEQAFTSNNMLLGIDNLFTNETDPNGNNSNIERLDYIFSGGIEASDDNVFAIFERGLASEHDGFKIAAITALDGSGDPAGYGTVLDVAPGTWGTVYLTTTHPYIILRADNGGADTFEPSAYLMQNIGGIAFRTSELAAPGTTIYGYSLFAPDVTGTGDQLLDWTNPTYFPTNTRWENANPLGGGLDPLGISSLLFSTTTSTTPLPEPGAASLVMLAGLALLGRRPRRR